MELNPWRRERWQRARVQHADELGGHGLLDGLVLVGAGGEGGEVGGGLDIGLEVLDGGEADVGLQQRARDLVKASSSTCSMDREAAAQLGRATELVRWKGKQRRRALPSDKANAGEEDPEDCRDGDMAGQCDPSEIWKVGLTAIAMIKIFF
jgi:hypothetical protein